MDSKETVRINNMKEAVEKQQKPAQVYEEAMADYRKEKAAQNQSTNSVTEGIQATVQLIGLLVLSQISANPQMASVLAQRPSLLQQFGGIPEEEKKKNDEKKSE